MAGLSLLYSWFDSYVDLFQQFVASKAVLAPLLLLLIEESGIPLPVPGDIIIAYTGYRLSVRPGSPALWQAFLAAQIAALLGATILFYLSRRWGQKLILGVGKFIFLKESHIRRAEQLFARWGVLAIIVGRHIPGLRIPITIFAATAGVSYPVFIGSTFVSTSVWILFYLFLGKRAGATFHLQAHGYVGTSLIVLAAAVAAVFIIHGVGLYRASLQKKAGKR